MAEEQAAQTTQEKQAPIVEAGKTSRWLTENGFEHESLDPDV
ncbi:MAG: NADH-quinone oxidoreductase subunit C, partial [Microcoleus sp. SIO2G3]|nr:NADH-quinone oxidoreductase subunit C [Microcoleus sp. SIO2G3]